MLWGKKDKQGITWASWDRVATYCGSFECGYIYLMTPRFSLLRDMCQRHVSDGLMHGKTKINASWWHLVNSSIALNIRRSVCAKKHLVKSWQDTLGSFVWAPPSSCQHCTSIQQELLVSSRLFYWQGKAKLRSQFNQMFQLGVVELRDVVDMDSQQLIEFEDAKQWLCIPPKLCAHLGEVA
jgi:hypothetical protein